MNSILVFLAQIDTMLFMYCGETRKVSAPTSFGDKICVKAGRRWSADAAGESSVAKMARARGHMRESFPWLSVLSLFVLAAFPAKRELASSTSRLRTSPSEGEFYSCLPRPHTAHRQEMRQNDIIIFRVNTTTCPSLCDGWRVSAEK